MVVRTYLDTVPLFQAILLQCPRLIVKRRNYLLRLARYADRNNLVLWLDSSDWRQFVLHPLHQISLLLQTTNELEP